MRSFTYHVPTEIVFGSGMEKEAGCLCKKYGGNRVLIVSGGSSARRSGLLDRLRDNLAKCGCTVTLFEGAQPNPIVSHAREGVAHALREEADLILAVGGGSAIDTAKAIAIGVKQPKLDLWEIWSKGLPVTDSLPVGVVLTIPAAGSETSASAILSNPAVCEKRSVRSPLNVPVFAILDPLLCATLSRRQVACGVVDIMMHTLDRYFNGAFDNETSDALAEAVLRTTIHNGIRAVEDPTDSHAMSELMWCGSLSHNSLTGLGGTRDFAVHKLGNELSACFDVIHAESLSAVWTAWAEYVCNAHPERFAQLGANVWGLRGGDLPHRTIRETDAYFRKIGMPVSLTELGIPHGAAGRLADCCSQNGGKSIGVFQTLKRQDMEMIYAAAYEEMK